MSELFNINENNFTFKINLNDLIDINRQFFRVSDYSNLSEIKKKLFANKEEFERIRYDYRDTLIKFRLNYLFVSMACGVGSFIGYDYILSYITFKRRFYLKMKFTFSLIFTMIPYYLLSNFFSINVTDISYPNSKFSIFIRLETHFRNGRLLDHISDLDHFMNKKFDYFHSNKSKNITEIELFLFYHDLKSHYINLSTVNLMLLIINGKVFSKYFNKYRYNYDAESKSKGILQKIKKELHKEYFKLLHSKQDQVKAKIEVPILTNENYISYVDPAFLILMDYEQRLRKIFLKEYLV